MLVVKLRCVGGYVFVLSIDRRKCLRILTIFLIKSLKASQIELVFKLTNVFGFTRYIGDFVVGFLPRIDNSHL